MLEPQIPSIASTGQRVWQTKPGHCDKGLPVICDTCMDEEVQRGCQSVPAGSAGC